MSHWVYYQRCEFFRVHFTPAPTFALFLARTNRTLDSTRWQLPPAPGLMRLGAGATWPLESQSTRKRGNGTEHHRRLGPARSLKKFKALETLWQLSSWVQNGRPRGFIKLTTFVDERSPCRGLIDFPAGKLKLVSDGELHLHNWQWVMQNQWIVPRTDTLEARLR